MKFGKFDVTSWFPTQFPATAGKWLGTAQDARRPRKWTAGQLDSWIDPALGHVPMLRLLIRSNDHGAARVSRLRHARLLMDAVYCGSSLPPKGEVMRTFSIRAAKTHLSRLIDQAAKGESFVITKAGKPLVKVIALDAADDVQLHSAGSLDSHIEVPADFDQMGAAEIEKLFTDDV